jgi:hypothetical protein
MMYGTSLLYYRVEFSPPFVRKKGNTELRAQRSVMMQTDVELNCANSFPFLSLAITIIGQICCVVCLNTTLTSHLHQRPIMLIGGTRAKFPNHVVQDDEPDNKIWGQVKLRQCCLSHLPIRASFMIDRSRPRGGRG